MERKTIRRFRGQEDLTDEQIAYMEYEKINPDSIPDENKLFTPLMSHIFAPDPATGWPASSLAIVLNDKTPPEIKEYIEQNLRISDAQHDGIDEQSIMDGIESMSVRDQYGQERQRKIDGLRKLIDKYRQQELVDKPS